MLVNKIIFIRFFFFPFNFPLLSLELERLLLMGFDDRLLNEKLLDKYNDDIDKVIDDLLKHAKKAY
jgi:hypothetical protein